ncbi:MAG TPA: TerC family protein [Chthoniobacterales bacterium]|nr:TerC family protein [Chthoniobacterales bacterium]
MERSAAVSTSIWFWIAFHVGVFIALAVDLISFKRRDRELSMRAASLRSLIWVVLSLGFNYLVWKSKGDEAGLDFLTGYIIEYSLSVDNIFVFVLIFSYFRVPPQSQHRVLVWGILGALVMRGVMIWLGVTLVERFHFVLYIFGAFLVLTGVRMLFDRDAKLDFEKNFFMRLCRKMLPITPQFHGNHFTARIDGRLMFTPLLLVLILVDVMDLVFAVDSIPAVFAITTDQFIVYTSNICAILGLRSLYFLLARMIDRFIYLKTGLALILGFVGTKMILAHRLPIPNWISLIIIVLILALTITISMLATRRLNRMTDRN